MSGQNKFLSDGDSGDGFDPTNCTLDICGKTLRGTNLGASQNVITDGDGVLQTGAAGPSVPGGADMEVQYNNAGVLAGVTGFIFDAPDGDLRFGASSLYSESTVDDGLPVSAVQKMVVIQSKGTAQDIGFMASEIAPISNWFITGFQIAGGSSTETRIVGPGSCRDHTNNFNMLSRFQLAELDITNSGLNGLDTGTVGASAWYAIHLIGDSTGVITVPGLVFSLDPITPTTFPAGYDRSRRIGYARTSAGSLLVPLSYNRMDGIDRQAIWGDFDRVLVLTNGAATVPTQILFPDFAPPDASSYYLAVQHTSPTPLGNAYAGFWSSGLVNDPNFRVYSGSTGAGSSSMFWLPTFLTGASIAYQNSEALTATDVWVLGFMDTLIPPHSFP